MIWPWNEISCQALLSHKTGTIALWNHSILKSGGTINIEINQSTYSEIPDADLASQAARGHNVIRRGVKSDSPGRSRMTVQHVATFARLNIAHTHAVVAMCWSD